MGNSYKNILCGLVSAWIAFFACTATAQTDFWQQTNGPFGGLIHSLAINSDGHIFAGTNANGVFRSTDNGDNWVPANIGLMNDAVLSLAINNSSGHIFAGVNGGGVFRSTNNGDSWTAVNNGMANIPVYSFAINSSGDIFAATSSGVFRSTNNGDNWTAVNTGLMNKTVFSLVINNSSGHIFVGTLDGGVFRSTDNGGSWSAVNTGLTNSNVQSLAINSSGHIFVAVTSRGVFRSTNNGDSWSAVNTGLTNSNVQSLAINSSGHIVAATFDGVFFSTNNGDRWTAANNTGLTNRDIRFLAFNSSGHIFAGTYGGVFRSVNNGDNWVAANTGLTNPKPSARESHAMAHIGSKQALLFGGNDGSLDDETWVYDLSANTWTLKSPATKPAARFFHALAYIGDDQVLLFGGSADETWVYDLSDNNWTLKSTATKPAARFEHAMAYIGGDQVLLFGGQETDFNDDDETWVYDLSDNTWTLRSPVTKPSARRLHAMAYLGGDQVLLFGGFDGSRSDETWIYDLSDNTWTLKSLTSKPAGRFQHAMADLGGDQVLLFSGNDGSFGVDETWVYTKTTRLVITTVATNIKTTSATLNGIVNPNGLSTTVKFEYGTTTSYGNEVTAIPNPITGANPVAVNATIADLTPGTMYHFRVVATNNAGATNGNDQTLMTLSNQAPIIASIPISQQPAGQEIVIQANITDDTGVSSVQLHYRRGGEVNFTVATMTATSGSSYQAVIPGSLADSRGVEYLLVATDTENATSRQPASGVFAIQIRVDNEAKPTAQPNGAAQAAYRLISVPLELDNKNAKAILEDDLGKYDDTMWRFSELPANQTYAEISDVTMIPPGKAFWLLVKDAGKLIDTGAGKSNITSRYYAIPLHPAWNFVANPFNFPIPVANLSLQSGKPLKLRTYSGNWNDPSTTPVDVIMPFEGYAVFNELSIFDTLLVNPDLSSTTNSLRKNITATATAPATDVWSIRILAQCQQARDVDNLAAVIPGAEIGFDAWDRPEPPPVGEYVAVSFPHRNWAPPIPGYCIDARPEPLRGEIWEFEVTTNIRDKVNLIFEGVVQVPKEFAVWLVDEALHISQNLRENEQYAVAVAVAVAVAGAGNPKRLKLVVGHQDFVTEKLGESEVVPTRYELSQNFPNPFNPVTTIRYGLPKEERVTLKIYNLLGEEVVTLVRDEQKEAGYHAAIWDGRDERGQLVASGIYLYQLHAGSFVQKRKMALVR